MKQAYGRLLLVLSIVVLTALFSGTGAFAMSEPIKLFGRDLEIRGSIQQNLDLRTHRDARDVQYSSFKTTFRLEGDYHISRTQGLDISLYTLAHYWFDTADSLDDNQRFAVRHEDDGSHGLTNFRRTNELEEILKECYLGIRGKTWEVRLGRQIVSWGETAFFQVADIVNPLDLTSAKAFPDFDDMKVGLWMARLFYTPPNIWQNISFDFLFLPPDFQPMRFPPAGHGLFFGVTAMPEGTFGQILQHMQHDAPGNDWNNSEWGMKIRGLTFDTDWSLQYFYGRQDNALINGQRGFGQFLNLLFGLPLTDEIFTFPHFHSAAFTFARAVPAIRSVVRGETSLTWKDYQYGTFEIKSKKLLVTALSIDRSVYVPWLTPNNRMRFLSTSITWFHNECIDHKYDKATGAFIAWEPGNAPRDAKYAKDSSWDTIFLMLDYGFRYDTILPSFYITYDFNGGTSLLSTLKYAPGDHWRYLVSHQQTNEQGRNAHMQDQVMFSIQYEF
jgi:hypothetical protein